MNQQNFRVVSWNILADAYVRRDRYPHCSDGALEPGARRSLLLRRVLDLDADIYAFQEVDPDAHEAIGAALGSAFEGAIALRPRRSEGVAIFVRRTKFQIEATTSLHYRAGSGETALIARISGDLVVASTHLKWLPRSTAASAHAGRQQLAELLDAVPAGIPLLCGDFNATSDSPVLEEAYARGYELAARSQRPWDTTNINERRRKIDYQLYRPGTLAPHPVALQRLERHTPLPSASEPSDHLPLTIDYMREP